MMTENVLVGTTVDFILGSAKNLELALQVEEAMPSLRERLIREVLASVVKRMSADNWQDFISESTLFRANAHLTLWREDWPRDCEPSEQMGILLGTDKAHWGQVYVGVYLSESIREAFENSESSLLQIVKEKYGKPPNEHGWVTYRYLKKPLYDWGSAEFLKSVRDERRRETLIADIVREIRSFEEDANALARAVTESHKN